MTSTRFGPNRPLNPEVALTEPMEALRPQGRGSVASNPESYVKLLLHRQGRGGDKYVISLRPTADYYGWPEEFEIWSPKPAYTSNGRNFFIDPGRKHDLRFHAGRRHYICRSPNLSGYPAGKTNAFRVSRNCGLLDLAELAHFTKGEWHWMTSPYGERITRERWERIYQSGIPGRRGVACSV